MLTEGLGFTTSRPYALNGPQGSFVTDQYVKAAHGKAVKEFPFIAASGGSITEVIYLFFSNLPLGPQLEMLTDLDLTERTESIQSHLS